MREATPGASKDPRGVEARRAIFLPRELRIAELSRAVAALSPDECIHGRRLVALRSHATQLVQRARAMRAA